MCIRDSTWSYHDSHLSANPGLGTFHASDLLEIFAGLPETSPKDTYQTYYTSFVYYLDPNAIGTEKGTLIHWPRYSVPEPQSLRIKARGNALVSDTFRQESYEFLSKHFGQLKV